MTDWTLMGRPLPSSHLDWDQEFEKYKQSPEFKWNNSGISLEEFKSLWYMEYTHRMWGRAVGAVFFVPAMIFWVKGLEHENFLGPHDVARVSQHRLAAHLSSAVILYSLLAWNAKDILFPAVHLDPARVTPSMVHIRWMAHGCKALVFLTLVSGAFVAGLDAGLVYNSFPKMRPKGASFE